VTFPQVGQVRFYWFRSEFFPPIKKAMEVNFPEKRPSKWIFTLYKKGLTVKKSRWGRRLGGDTLMPDLGATARPALRSFSFGATVGVEADRPRGYTLGAKVVMLNARRVTATAKQHEGRLGGGRRLLRADMTSSCHAAAVNADRHAALAFAGRMGVKIVIGSFPRIKPRPKSMPEISYRGPRLRAFTPAGYKHAMTTVTALLECRIV
jgi:hypothetical protein